MYDGSEYRGVAREDVEEQAKYAGVPVWKWVMAAIMLPTVF